MLHFIVNDEEVRLDVPPGEVLLDVLRGRLRLTGTKEGCREGDCGSCVVLLGERFGEWLRYRPVNSCLFPAGDVAGKHVLTIEGLSTGDFNAVQRAIIDEGATQCGFCTPGIVMSLTAFLLNADALDEDEAVQYVSGNICRCTGYVSIRRAVRTLCGAYDARAFKDAYPDAAQERLSLLVSWGAVPSYVQGIHERLGALASELKSRAPSDAATMVGGGTDLFVGRARSMEGRELSFLSGRSDLKGVWVDGAYCVIGAATTMEQLRESFTLHEIVPHIETYFDLIAAKPIRLRATVGGNVVNASPIGDLEIILLAFDASAVLSDGTATREVKLRDFFLGYKHLDMEKGEIVMSFRFPLPHRDARFNFEKVSQRTHLDIASVNSAMQIHVSEGKIMRVHISAGGVAPIPFYLSKTSAYLSGKDVAMEHVLEAEHIARGEVKPISDVRGTKEYKHLLMAQLIRAHFVTLFPDLRGGEGKP